MHLTHQIQHLLTRQLQDWPLAMTNYATLSLTQTKHLSINNFTFTIQFNPTRLTSSSAQTDPQTIQNRKCFLCPHHLPPEQEILPYTAQSLHQYAILCNPYPIFPRHLTIPDRNHTPQLISGRIDDMLELAAQLSDFVLFYNGPQCGASAPDHFHFQAGNKGFLPIQATVESGISLAHYPVSAFLFESEEASEVAASFHQFLTTFQEPEPMLNLLCWKTGSKYYLIVFPRKRHRPTQFYAQGDDNILLSPGAVDLGGVLITPLEKDFQKLSISDVTDIFDQITNHL